MLAEDAAARAHALDVTRSWLVQAPAGSGKTGLLIQRYLALLATVETPERVVAMTFTRKAAAELRERVLAALEQAANAGGAPASEHEQATVDLACRALAQDRRHDWQLRQHPARLRIETIDAFTTALARAAPLRTGLGALPQFVDDATPLYRAAARAALAHAPPDDPAWRTFLQWIDNDAQAAVGLIAQMLAARERWRGFFDGPPEALRANVERVLADEICASLRALRTLFPAHLTRAVATHARAALAYLEDQPEEEEAAARLRAVLACADLPEAAIEALETWRALVDWTMNKNAAFFQQVTKRHGFPAAGNGPGALERRARRDAYLRWLDDARSVPGLEAALAGVRGLPPARFDDEAWAFVAATLAILPQAAAYLLTVMAAQHQSDFAEAMLRALDALGTAEAPEALLLALDARIQHLLIDEFQDTSAAQLELVKRLTAGWQPGDGRTLFAVGDPMQSIYRFREAEVDIFIKAQARGRIADVPVGTLELGRNFRSRAAIVQWVNDVFAQLLPAAPQAGRGEVSFRPAHAHDSRTEPSPVVTLCADRNAEALAVVDAVRAAQAEGAQTIAVLVRARAHVQAVLPALREAGIAYHAVDLEPLQERLPTRDLVSLARALAQPADRVAWLGILRAPWCGLTLADLLVLAGPRDERSLLQALDDPATLARLSPDGAARARRLRAALEPALAARGRTTFALRVRAAWLALGGPLCAETALDRDGADRVFALIAAHERAGDLADYDAFVAAAQRLYALPPAAPQGVVQIMTLHKAKGLEFDAVVLPGLDQKTGGGETRPLRWKVREGKGRRALVLAPLKSRMGADAQADPVHAWLGALDAAEDAAELTRLLYVGATRARHRLHLLAVAKAHEPKDGDVPQWRAPMRGSALERIWPALAWRIAPPDAASVETAEAEAEEVVPESPHLTRMPATWDVPVPASILVADARPPDVGESIAFDWAHATAAAVGTVAHRLLAQIGREGLDAWTPARVASAAPRVRAELALAGVAPSERAAAGERVLRAVQRTLEDPRGRWLFSPAHTEPLTECALAGLEDGATIHVALDRSFVSEGVRWIVDFKTGAHDGAGTAAFLEREVERYRPQLQRYARLLRHLDARPIRLALYYPLVEDGFRSFDFTE
jgi:ATP-dependent helicase/nuclease subunit A